MFINKIENIASITKRDRGQEIIEITIKNKDTGEILYQNESLFGLLYSSEKIMRMNLEIEDVHQIFAWGNIYMWPHAIKMFKENFKKRKDKFFKSIDALDIPQNQKDLLKTHFNRIV